VDGRLPNAAPEDDQLLAQECVFNDEVSFTARQISDDTFNYSGALGAGQTGQMVP